MLYMALSLAFTRGIILLYCVDATGEGDAQRRRVRHHRELDGPWVNKARCGRCCLEGGLLFVAAKPAFSAARVCRNGADPGAAQFATCRRGWSPKRHPVMGLAALASDLTRACPC